jgi:hypothetical protein
MKFINSMDQIGRLKLCIILQSISIILLGLILLCRTKPVQIIYMNPSTEIISEEIQK